MLSDTAEYALRAVLFIADRSGNGNHPVPVEIVARTLGMPANYLSKTLNQLTKAGILSSQRGPHGGFRLATGADDLRLVQIVAPFDEVGGIRRCLLGREACSDANPCPAHARWKAVADRIQAFFAGTTVADLLEDPDRLEALKPRPPSP